MTKLRSDLDNDAFVDDKPVLRPPRTQTFKNRWIKPVLLTSLVYALIGGLIYFTTSSSDTPTQSQTSPIEPVRTIIPALTADEIATPVSDSQALSQQTQTSAPTSNPQTDKALFNSPPIVNSAQANTPVNLPATPTIVPNDVNVMPNDYTNNAPTDSALSEAIDDSDAQNDSLRVAINQARQINDEKISQAISRPHLSPTDSQVSQSPAYGADSTDGANDDIQPEDIPKAP